ncbi:MAG TPA: TolC family protein, partial [Thermoanaerobaculia bacterium]|nr:TolC family protein [Thermoanaerobaculia bacterium]
MSHRFPPTTSALASILLLTATLLASPLAAATPAPPVLGSRTAPAPPAGPLTLAQCVHFALAESPATRAATAALEAARQSTEVARSSFYPSVGLNAGFSRWQRRIFLPSELEKIPGFSPLVGPYDDWTASIGASYTLFDGGKRRARLGAAEAGEAGSDAAKTATRQEVALAVEQAFYGVLAARESHDVAVKSLARSKDHVKLAEDRKEVGAVPLADVLRAKVEAANAKLALVQAEGFLRTARGRLATVMGLPSETAIEITTDRASIAAPASPDLSADLD